VSGFDDPKYDDREHAPDDLVFGGTEAEPAPLKFPVLRVVPQPEVAEEDDDYWFWGG
jgi:hypothetical protein